MAAANVSELLSNICGCVDDMTRNHNKKISVTLFLTAGIAKWLGIVQDNNNVF